ncbi:hypothetical protein PLESTB_001352700 [Pleodorina starrii]|uniref:Uncharacterized protein n=1 Tax=Pleodorina starrii TaxID=330485 RepID=A0A9W6F7C3_9CHLO|nr:hypothetical protein PLESTB_001352700 [Pleodorina starrii]GLC69473.1 hypothetical protein PLESTF_000834600 [Pleodorina starrii]
MDGGTCTTVTVAVGGTAWLYCQVCLYWSNDRGSCVKSTQDTVSHVCMADQFFPVIAASGGQPTVGNTAKLNNWNDGVGDRYCQWVRWNSSNYDTEVVRFTVKDGSGTCREAASPLQVTLQGISATCQSPRVVNNTLAGCGTGDQTNECLWTFNVPRPGTPAFNPQPPVPPAPSPAVKLPPPPVPAGPINGLGSFVGPVTSCKGVVQGGSGDLSAGEDGVVYGSATGNGWVIAALGTNCTDVYTGLPLPYEVSSSYYVFQEDDSESSGGSSSSRQSLVVTPVNKLLQYTGVSRTPVQVAYGMLGVNASSGLSGALAALKDNSAEARLTGVRMLYADALLSSFVVLATSALSNLPPSSLPLCATAARKVDAVYTALAARAATSGSIDLRAAGLLNTTILSVARTACNASASGLQAAGTTALAKQAEAMYGALAAQLNVGDGLDGEALSETAALLSAMPLRALSAATRASYVSQTRCTEALAATARGADGAAAAAQFVTDLPSLLAAAPVNLTLMAQGLGLSVLPPAADLNLTVRSSAGEMSGCPVDVQYLYPYTRTTAVTSSSGSVTLTGASCALVTVQAGCSDTTAAKTRTSLEVLLPPAARKAVVSPVAALATKAFLLRDADGEPPRHIGADDYARAYGSLGLDLPDDLAADTDFVRQEWPRGGVFDARVKLANARLTCVTGPTSRFISGFTGEDEDSVADDVMQRLSRDSRSGSGSSPSPSPLQLSSKDYLVLLVRSSCDSSREREQTRNSPQRGRRLQTAISDDLLESMYSTVASTVLASLQYLEELETQLLASNASVAAATPDGVLRKVTQVAVLQSSALGAALADLAVAASTGDAATTTRLTPSLTSQFTGDGLRQQVDAVQISSPPPAGNPAGAPGVDGSTGDDSGGSPAGSGGTAAAGAAASRDKSAPIGIIAGAVAGGVVAAALAVFIATRVASRRAHVASATAAGGDAVTAATASVVRDTVTAVDILPGEGGQGSALLSLPEALQRVQVSIVPPLPPSKPAPWRTAMHMSGAFAGDAGYAAAIAAAAGAGAGAGPSSGVFSPRNVLSTQSGTVYSAVAQDDLDAMDRNFKRFNSAPLRDDAAAAAAARQPPAASGPSMASLPGQIGRLLPLPPRLEPPPRRATVSGTAGELAAGSAAASGLAADIVGGRIATAREGREISVNGAEGKTVRSALAPRLSRQQLMRQHSGAGDAAADAAADDVDDGVLLPPPPPPPRRVTLSGAEGPAQLSSRPPLSAGGRRTESARRFTTLQAAGPHRLSQRNLRVDPPTAPSAPGSPPLIGDAPADGAATMMVVAGEDMPRRRVTASGWEDTLAATSRTFLQAARWSMRRMNLAVSQPPEPGLPVTRVSISGDGEPPGTPATGEAQAEDAASSARRLPTPRVMMLLRPRSGAVVPAPAPTAPELP